MKKQKLNLLKVFLVMSLVVLPLGLNQGVVNAAALTSISDTLEDSRPSTAANHTITFVTPTGVALGETITITFPAGFGGVSSITHEDVDLHDGTNDHTDATDCTGSEEMGVSASGQVITLEICAGDGGNLAASTTVTIEIGDHSVESGTNQITNHATAAVYTVQVGGTMTDSGDALIAVVDTLTATVSIDETLSFSVAGVASASCDDRPDVTTEITTTATSVPFGTTTGDEFIDGCQSLTVSTNAANGYSVTAAESDQLTFGGSTIADGTCDGSCTETTDAAWATDTNNGLGYCLQDVSGTDVQDFSGVQCDDVAPQFKIFPELGTDTPETIMSNAGVVSGSNAHVGYRLSVSSSQGAGTYTNDIIFVATPTY
ncbi:hypothetical protein ACFLY9_00050 [Patescibacteria group bacterium]